MAAGAGAAMNWTLYTKAIAAQADYAAALARVFGSAACEARSDCSRNGSRPDHPLHPPYAAENEAADVWSAEMKKVAAEAA